jgi:hypothetical protein
VFLGCEDQSQVAEQKRTEQAAQTARWKAERDAEQSLMKTPALAIAMLQERLSSWISVSDGVAVIVGEGSVPSLHALPTRSPWLVSCGTSGIEVTITHWAGEDLIVRRLTRAPLTAEECRPLVSAVGQKMLALLGKP